MKDALQRFKDDRRGASAVEFAILSVPLIVLLLGTVEIGRMIWTKGALQSIAMAGARCAALPEQACSDKAAFDPAKTAAFVIEAAKSAGIALTVKEVVVDAAATCSGLDGFTRVTVSHKFMSSAQPIVNLAAEGAVLEGSACFANQPT